MLRSIGYSKKDVFLHETVPKDNDVIEKYYNSIKLKIKIFIPRTGITKMFSLGINKEIMEKHRSNVLKITIVQYYMAVQKILYISNLFIVLLLIP